MVLPAGVYEYTTITIPDGVTITTDAAGGLAGTRPAGGAGGQGRIRLSANPSTCVLTLGSVPPVMTGCTPTNMTGAVYIGVWPD